MIKIIALIVLILLVMSCAANISDIKDDSNIGKKVSVKGIVENPIKIGKLSGYALKDKNGDRIAVASEELPKDGDSIIVRGILMKDTLLGYYIKAD